MVPAPFTPIARDPALAELVSYSSKAALRKQVRRSPHATVESLHLSTRNWFSGSPAQSSSAEPSRETRPGWELAMHHAPPLMPLREQDSQALTELFVHDDMDGISRDICQTLNKYYPEPCWEDELVHTLAEWQ